MSTVFEVPEREEDRRRLRVPPALHDAVVRGVDIARAHPRRALVVGILALLVVIGLARTSRPRGVLLAPVRSGPFAVSIVEAGTVQALRSVSYASAIQSNQAKIVALVPEGKLVQKGDLLILFDAAPFEEEIRRNQALLEQAEADLRKAKEDVRLQQIQNEEEMASARQKVEKSELELRDVQEGKGRLREEEAKAAVAGAERELKKAEGQVEDLRPLLKEGFITRQELERAEQVVQKAREDLELAKQRQRSLAEFGRPLELSQARSDASLTRESLRQLRSSANARLEQKNAAISGAQSRIQEASAKLALAKQQLARTEVRADVPGLVVYRDVFFGSEQRRAQVGDQVWANQPLLILPDISRMVVETKVRETDIHKVARNQKVTVRVDAYPDLRLTGKVTLLGSLAQEEKERRGAKYFTVTIEVNEGDQRLRPGMSARVEIEVDERKQALSVPVEAVFERDGQSVCFVRDGGRLTRRAVVLGPSSANAVVIERGLAEGDEVALRDPDAAPEGAAAPSS